MNKITALCVCGAELSAAIIGMYAVYIWNAFSKGDIEDMYTVFCGMGTLIVQAVIFNITKRASAYVVRKMEMERLREEEKTRKESYMELLNNYKQSEQVIEDIKGQIKELKKQVEGQECAEDNKKDEKQEVRRAVNYIDMLEKQIDKLMEEK